jgi:Rhodopirellula transposase DDE domain
MEQDRAQAVFVHQHELACQAARQLRYRVIVDLISATTTETGLTVRCELDTSAYPKGIVVTDQEMSQINMLPDDFHGEWNYTLLPRNKQDRVANS